MGLKVRYKTEADIIFSLLSGIFFVYLFFLYKVNSLLISTFSVTYDLIIYKCKDLAQQALSGHIFFLVVTLLLSLFLIGTLFKAFFTLISSFLKTERYINSLPIIYSLSNKQFTVFYSKHYQSFVYGFFNSKIYISTATLEKLDKDQLNALLLHEYAHKIYLHNFKKFVIRLTVLMIPFFLNRGSLYKGFESINEIVADEYSYMKTGSKKLLIQTIYTMMGRNTFENDSFFLSNFTIKVSRVDSLISKENLLHRNYIASLSLTLVTIIGLLFLLKPIEASANESTRSSTFGICIENQKKVEKRQSEQLQSPL